MTKYSTMVKVQAVQEYLELMIGSHEICRRYNISNPCILYKWVHQVQANGYESLKVSHHKHIYSIDFKLKVINYYRTHELGLRKVAIKFGINDSQVFSWYRRYQKEGIVGLRPTHHGRPSKNVMSKPKNHQRKQSLSPTKEEQYKQKIADLEAKLDYQQMELDILKKLQALRQQEEKHKH